MSTQTLPLVLRGRGSFSISRSERSRREEQYHEKGSQQRNHWATWRGHMLNRELLQHRRYPPECAGNNCQEGTLSTKEDAQGSQESCAGFCHLQQIRAEKQHSNANGLAPTRNHSEGEPGGEQR